MSEPAPGVLARVSGWWRLWFTFGSRVNRRTYLVHGASLMGFKYALDAAAVWVARGVFWSPLDYLSPLLSARVVQFQGASEWFGWAMVAWTLPFLWIGLSMTLRRAVDAGISPWWSLLFLAPIANYALMIVLCPLPSRAREAWRPEVPAPVVDARFRSALAGSVAAVGIVLAMVGVSALVLGTYGLTLFLATPFVLGAMVAYVHNRGHARTTAETELVVSLSLLVVGGSLLLFAVEGAVCILMALPLAVVLAALGGIFGRVIALRSPTRLSHGVAAVLALPLFAGLESRDVSMPLFEVVSVVEIDAPPEAVWPEVVAFQELPEPGEWLFHLGIAYPQLARIEGSGVGALRRCEFSTGAFVEPITVWEEPRRLGFDVIEQPPPLEEWSPYRTVHPPHLDGYFRSKRGEFRLIGLPDGRTRLEGRTWYELDLSPRIYWKVYADVIIHAIHARVLAQVKRRAEGTP